MTAALAAGLAAWMAAAVLPGVDRLRQEKTDALRGKRIGLITNHTGKAIDGTSTLQVLKEELGLDVRALFSPEHGLSGTEAAGVHVASGSDLKAGIPVFSIYGDTRKPTSAMLRGLDVLVFDIQDIGVRFYTYISTLKLTMEAAAENGLEFVVLDRPSPRAAVVEGPILEPKFASFVGIAPIPLVHGMTVGELGSLWNEEGWLEGKRRVRFRVILVEGWKRSMTWEETGLQWTPTSPNIRTSASAVVYPALGLFEGVNVSEGRGTKETFEIAGAPWIDREKLVSALEALELPGVRFTPYSFIPQVLPEAPVPIYPNVTCEGFRVTVNAPNRFEAVRTGLSVLATIRRAHGTRFEWKKVGERFVIDRLLGSDRPRLQLDAGEPVEAIIESFAPALARFRALREKYLLYE